MLQLGPLQELRGSFQMDWRPCWAGSDSEAQASQGWEDLFIQGTVIALITRRFGSGTFLKWWWPRGSPHAPLGSPEDAMLLIGTLLPEASEEEAGVELPQGPGRAFEDSRRSLSLGGSSSREEQV